MHTPNSPKLEAHHSACWHNGKLIPVEQASVSVFDHGLLYGDGVFEGLRFYGGRVFKLERHLQRLEHSLQALAITLMYERDELVQGIQRCIEESTLKDGYMRIIVTRGEGSLGLNPKHCKQANVFMIATEMELLSPEVQARGLNLVTVSTRRMTGSGLDSRVKSLNYLHSILAKTEANHAGADDGLLLNQHGTIAECSAANLFVVKDDVLSTPPCTDGALEGITRETVLELACEQGMRCLETSMTAWDVYNADECFITGSAARLMSVASLDGRAIRDVNGPHYTALLGAFMNTVRS